jgi:hypothetical protein
MWRADGVVGGGPAINPTEARRNELRSADPGSVRRLNLTRSAAVTMSIVLLSASLAAGRGGFDKFAAQPGFNSENVVRRVRAGRSTPRELAPHGGTDGVEFPVDTVCRYVRTTGGKSDPAVAFDGINYLVVWSEDRLAGHDIFGARVTTQGRILDTAGIIVFLGPDAERDPAVAFDGANYLVVWQRYTSNGKEVWATRVAPSGVVVDSAAIQVSDTDWCYFPQVAYGGGEFLVVWYQMFGNVGVYAARVSTAGVRLDTSAIQVSAGAWPAVSFDGESFLVVWKDSRNGNNDIYAARVSPAGSILDTAGIAVSTAANGQYDASVTFDGSDWLVVWTDTRAGPSVEEIYGARVNGSGAVLDPNGIAICGVEGSYTPSIASCGGISFVVWNDSRALSGRMFGARVDASGTVLDTEGFLVASGDNGGWRSCVAACDSGYIIAWVRHFFDVIGMTTDERGRVRDTLGFSLTASMPAQLSPSVVSDGTNYFVVWSERRAGSQGIYGIRISNQGAVVDESSFAICTTDGWRGEPAVAFDGTGYLVVWTDSRDSNAVFGARATPDGAVLDPGGFAISASSSAVSGPRVAWGSGSFLVVWSDGAENGDVFGARVSADGAVQDTSPIPIAVGAGYEGRAAVASDGVNWLAVWGHSLPRAVQAVRIGPDGNLLDTVPISIVPENVYSTVPAVAACGSEYLIVWTGAVADSADICGARVSADGTLLDSSWIPICADENVQRNPSITSDGEEYAVVWRDFRTGRDWDIRGTRLEPSGSLADSFAVSTRRGDQTTPAVTYGSGSQTIAIYSGLTEEVNGNPANSNRIWGRLSPFGAVQENPRHSVARSRLIDGPSILRGMLRIAGTGDPRARLALLDITGREVMSVPRSALPNSQPVDVSGLATGVYFVRLPSVCRRDAANVSKVVIVR